MEPGQPSAPVKLNVPNVVLSALILIATCIAIDFIQMFNNITGKLIPHTLMTMDAAFTALTKISHINLNYTIPGSLINMFGAVYNAFILFLLYMMWLGKKWARTITTILLLAWILPNAISIGYSHFAPQADTASADLFTTIELAELVMEGMAVFLLYTEVSNAWFFIHQPKPEDILKAAEEEEKAEEDADEQ